jgi:hypothetical protein
MSHLDIHILRTSVAYRGGFGVSTPPPPEIPKFWQSWAEIVLKYQKLRKCYYMKLNFLYQITAAARTPWLGGYRPQIPLLSVLCPQLNLLDTPPPRTKYLGTPVTYVFSGNTPSQLRSKEKCLQYRNITMPYQRAAQIFQKFTGRLRKVTWSKFCNEGPKILCHHTKFSGPGDLASGSFATLLYQQVGWDFSLQPTSQPESLM